MISAEIHQLTLLQIKRQCEGRAGTRLAGDIRQNFNPVFTVARSLDVDVVTYVILASCAVADTILDLFIV